MKIIHKPANLVENILGKQTINNSLKYRPLLYLIQQPVDEGMLIYNVMTKCMILLSQNELEHYNEIEFLKENWFFVPEFNDDKKNCLQLRNLANILYNTNNAINHYCIFTTTDCNARCFYCYEQGTPRISMNLSTADKIVNFIIKNHKSEAVKIRWFGGEPLYNLKVIDYITAKLKDNRIKFSSSMVSNGYLFDSSVLEKAISNWNLKVVQITLDGTEKKYNKSKHFIYKNINAFEVVVNNIKKISEAGIVVQIRLNIDKYNISDMHNLVDYLCELFSGNNYIKIYTAKLFENVEHGAVIRTDEERKLLFKQAEILEEKIAKFGLSFCDFNIADTITFNSCMADNKASLIVLPSGKLGKCEHFQTQDFCGDLDRGIIYVENCEKFTQEIPHSDKCDSCAFFPDCIRLVHCYKDKICYDEAQESLIKHSKIRMLNTYNSYLKKQQITEDENDEIEIQC